MAEEREIKDMAIVLSSEDYGEADRMVTLLTASRGKIKAKMRGVKKAKAKLAYASFPFNLGEYIIVKRGRSYTVINCSYIDNFSSLTYDLNLYYAASGILEAAAGLARDESNSYELFMLVLKSLKDLAYNKDANLFLVLGKFLIETLGLAGFKISLDGNFDPLKTTYFDFELGKLTNERKNENIELSSSDSENLYSLIELSTEELDITAKGSKTVLKLLVLFFEHKVDEELTIIKKFI